ncbi:MAG: T9SS type A sorting domain-containing protein [Bacteroidia bacterium]|nr:T9SS type A sorting domain-containing protein [Bacteroidia bacterium]
MQIKRLLQISGIGMLSVLGINQFTTTEKKLPVQSITLFQATEQKIERKIVVDDKLSLKVETKIKNWHTHCRLQADTLIGLFEVRNETSHCGGDHISHCGGHKVYQVDGVVKMLVVPGVIVEEEKKQAEAPVEIREMAFKVYPNPMQTEARLEIANYNDEPYSFELYDLSGKLVMKEVNITNSVYVIPRNDLSAGIYIYRVMMNFNNAPLLKSGKIVVE